MGFAQRIRDNLTEHRAAHAERHLLFRILFAMAGSAVLLAGIVMLVTPGPGIPVIILGLGMLALEFAWAERWLERLLTRAERAVDQVTQGSPVRRAALLTVGILAIVASVVLVIFWDIPFLPG
jgi:uncharacterized protein (TIGR02611 family)